MEIIVAADIKPKEYWFQEFETADNHFSMDMKDIKICKEATKNIDLFLTRLNMGGGLYRE